MKYRRNGTVEAMQYHRGQNEAEICRFAGDRIRYSEQRNACFVVERCLKTYIVDGDYIVKDRDGEVSAREPKSFLREYEPDV